MIYFVQIGADGPIKIGFTSASSPVDRLRALQVGVPYELRLLGVISGGSAQDERRLHASFDQHRLRGEWFIPVSEVLEYSEGNAAPAVDSVREDDTVRIAVIMPAELHQKLVALAQDDDRSLNSYLVQLLKKHAERNEKDDQGIPL